MIVGWITKTKLVNFLFAVCGLCHIEASQRLYRIRRWHTIMFIPIYPLGHGKYVLQCANCGAESQISREEAERVIVAAEAFHAELAAPDDEATQSAQ